MAQAVPQHLMANNVFCESLAGEEFGRLYSWGNHPSRKADYDLASPTRICDLPQNFLEPILIEAAGQRGTSLCFNTEFVDLVQDADGVTATVKDRLSGETYQIRAKYLIGADGGRSRVAEVIGLPMEGQMGRAGSMNIIVQADLSKYVAHRPSVLYWVLQPGAEIGGIGAGLIRMVRPWNEWLIIWGYDIEQGERKLSNDEAISIVRNLVGDETLEVKVRSTSTWTVNEMYAGHYRVGPRVLRRRRGAPPSADQRPRLQHLDPGFLQSVLEAQAGARRACGAVAARDLFGRAPAGRQADRDPRQQEHRRLPADLRGGGPRRPRPIPPRRARRLPRARRRPPRARRGARSSTRRSPTRATSSTPRRRAEPALRIDRGRIRRHADAGVHQGSRTLLSGDHLARRASAACLGRASRRAQVDAGSHRQGPLHAAHRDRRRWLEGGGGCGREGATACRSTW